ncbi:hypothetical protein IHE45_07G076700 [Dioscorea alata]|uniref:Uncharacterized protein n=1 Tax=Dioscorea alata TaxID=55571 RepID=A0ACB7VSE6_DIOAL|nr:hypothetical protein IHE45_07G076700 [Dioscorea alata]
MDDAQENVVGEPGGLCARGEVSARVGTCLHALGCVYARLHGWERVCVSLRAWGCACAVSGSDCVPARGYAPWGASTCGCTPWEASARGCACWEASAAAGSAGEETAAYGAVSGATPEYSSCSSSLQALASHFHSRFF